MPDQALAFLREFGLPLSLFVGLVWAGYKGWIRWGPQVDAESAAREKQWAEERSTAAQEIAYRETLRVEERIRSDKLETGLTTALGALRDMTEVLKDVERELARIRPSSR